MSGAEFAFTLFGLLLGLALAEGLGGLARALKARHKVRIGWPTALLGLFVSCDVVTFWMYGWAMRKLLQIRGLNSVSTRIVIARRSPLARTAAQTRSGELRASK